VKYVRADENAAIIDAGFGLKVLTEEEHLNARGQIVGNGTANPLAAAFATSVSQLFSQIASQRPAWRELDNLAWMVALARTLRYRKAIEQARLDIDWLLDTFALPGTDVPKTVPGHSTVQRYDYRRAVEGGYVVGAVLAGVLADLLGLLWAVGAIAGLTALSGIVASLVMRETLGSNSI